MSSIRARRFVPVAALTLCLSGSLWAQPGEIRPWKEHTALSQGQSRSALDLLFGLLSRVWASSESQPNPAGDRDLSQSPPPSPGDNGAQLDPNG